MEDKETLLYEVVFDAKRAQEQAESLRSAIAQLRKEKQETEKDFKKGTIAVEEYAKSMQAIETQLAGATSQLKSINKEIDNNGKVAATARGSLNQMRATLSALIAEYDSLSKSQRTGSKEALQLQARIKSLSDELKEAEEATGRNYRSVGDYAKGLRVAGVSVGEMETAVKEGYQSFKVFTSGITATKGALIALAAVPILLFLTGFVALLKSTDEGADKLEQSVAFLSAGFSSLMKGIAPLGKLLVDTFTSPIETVKKLVAGTDEYSVSLAGVASAAIQAGLAQAEYTKSMQDFEDRQDALIGVQAKVNEQVQLALTAVKDRSRSERERINLLDSAGAAERKLAAETLAIKKGEYDALKKLQSQKDNLQDDDRKASRQAYADYVNARAASATTEQQIQNRRSALIEQEAADRKSSAEKATAAEKKAAQERVYEAERALIQARKNGQETLSIEEEIVCRTGAVELVGLAKNSQQRKLIQAKTEADILKLRVDAAIQADTVLYNTEQDRLNARLSLATKGTQAEVDLQKKLLEVRLDQEKSAVVDAAKTQQQTEANRKALIAKLRALDAKFNADTEQLDKSFAQSQIQRDQALGNERIQAEQDFNEQTLEQLRDLAARRITLEEKTQLDLLALETLSEEDRDTKRNAIIAKATKARRDLAKQERIDILNDQKADADAALALSKEGSKAERDARIQQINVERQLEIEAANGNAKAIRKINAQANRAIADEKKAFLKKEIDKVVDIANQATQALDKLVTAQGQTALNNLQKQQDAALSSAGLSAEMRADIEEKFAAKRIELEREVANKKKKIASVENIINTAASITKSFVEYGPILGGILAAIALANGIAQQTVIDSQQFANGGVVKGPSHAGGGVKYSFGRNRTVELEGDEGVINKRSMSIPWVRREASRLNQVGGGVAFDGVGGYTPSYRMEYGGSVPHRGSDGGSYSDFLIAIKSLPRPVVDVGDIRAGVDNQISVESFADIRK